MSVPPVDPIALPAPASWFTVLLVATFFLHLLPMNFALGCSFIAPWAAWRGRGVDGDALSTLSRQLSALLPIFLALAITMGVAPLLFVQVLYGRFFFTSAILMGWFWLAVIPLLLAAYSLIYLVAWKRDTTGKRDAWVGFTAGILLVLIAFLYTNNMSRMIRPSTFGDVYRAEPRGLTLNLSDPSLWPRYLHFLIASIAVSGLFLTLLAWIRAKREGGRYYSKVLRLGSSLFVHPTLLQLLVGPWLLVSLPDPVRTLFLGGSTRETASLGLGVLAALVAVALVMQSPNRHRPGPYLAAAASCLLLSLSLMVTVRHFLRNASLSPVPGESQVTVQAPALVIFVMVLLTALALVGWMLRTWMREAKN